MAAVSEQVVAVAAAAVTVSLAAAVAVSFVEAVVSLAAVGTSMLRFLIGQSTKRKNYQIKNIAGFVLKKTC